MTKAEILTSIAEGGKDLSGVASGSPKFAGFLDLCAGALARWKVTSGKGSGSAWGKWVIPSRPEIPEVSISYAQLGLNAVRLLHQEKTLERKYGTTAGLLDDFSALGVGIVRQPTNGNLVWPGGVEVPVETSGGGEIRAALDGAGVFDDVADLFWALIQHGTDETAQTATPRIKVVLTMLNTRDGDPDIVDSTFVVDPAVPTPEYVSSGSLPPSSGVEGSVIRLDWAEGHGGQTIRWWDGVDHPFDEVDLVLAAGLGTVDGAYDTAGTDILYHGLDGRSSYKLYYVYLIARTFGEILLEVESEIATRWADSGYSTAPPSIFDFLHAIELGNEVNAKNVVYDPVAVEAHEGHSAILWFMISRELLRGLQEGLGGQRVDVWLPSMWSYALSETTSTHADLPQKFSNLYTFDAFLFVCFGLQSARDWLEPEAPARVDTSWISNQDYHFYHKTGAGAAILQLTAEVEALRALGERWLTPTSGRAVGISVCESGASVHETSADYVWIAGMAAAATPTGVDDPLYQRFQAREVWRRMATALCGTTMAAWHTPMSNLEVEVTKTGPEPVVRNFTYMGLRVDTAYDSSGTADLASTRPSYWSFQRVAELLAYVDASGTTRGWHGEVVAWTRTSSANYYQDLDRANHDDMLVILEFVLGPARLMFGGAWRYAYVILLDPVCGLVDASVRPITYADSAPKTVSISLPHGGSVIQVPSLPAGIDFGTDGDETTFNTDSPYATTTGMGDWSTAYTTLTTGGATSIDVYVSGPDVGGAPDLPLGDPIVLLSEWRLEFA